MAIPKEILSIERPSSTVVRKTGNIYYKEKYAKYHSNSIEGFKSKYSLSKKIICGYCDKVYSRKSHN